MKPVEIAALAIIDAAPTERLEARVAEICAILKGPGVSFKERLILNEERHFLRDLLLLQARAEQPAEDRS